MEKLSVSLEDYIEEIYKQVLKKGSAKVTEISSSLNVKKSSVTGALNVLCEKKLINYTPYSAITLTISGKKTAKSILDKHEKISEFFNEILGVPREDALKTACKMEHIVTEEIFSKIKNFTEFIKEYSLENKEFREKMYNCIEKAEKQ